MGIDNQQTRLDSLDQKVDKKITIEGEDYAGVIIHQVDQLLYNLDSFPEEMQADIQAELLNNLSNIDLYNISQATAALSVKIEAWNSGESVCESGLVISDEFHQINNNLNISEDNLQTYYETAVENKVDISKMRIQLEEIDLYFLKELDQSLKQTILINIFGKLVNGETGNLVDNQIGK